jgi:hypothetical protein
VSPAPPAESTDGDETVPVPDDEAETPAAEADSVAGRWDLTNEVEATSHAPFAGLTLGYRLTLRQEGNHVFGRGRKYTENGVLLPPEQRTAIAVDGHIEGPYLILSFSEQGAERSSSGTMRWRIAGEGAMQGRFASDAAQSSGSSVARRVR